MGSPYFVFKTITTNKTQQKMENVEKSLAIKTKTFIAPSGFEYTIREQNGADDDVISNASDAQTLMNFSKFLVGIVMGTNLTPNGKLTLEQAHNLPVLDRYAILINSRIFSIGDELEFTYDWGADQGGKITYTQNLNEFIFEDYSQVPSDSEVIAKPYAIPYYPNRDKFTGIEVDLTSGKKIKFDLLTAVGEAFIVNLPVDARTKNKELEARNLQLLVDDKWEKVRSFHVFSVKDMKEIRKAVAESDPVFDGTMVINNPKFPGSSTSVSIMGLKDFFYPEEI